MSSHDHHDHSHPHDHSHSHDHHHDHEKGPLSLKEQLEVLLNHWVDHNDAHKGNYITWAERAKQGGFEDAATTISEIADMTDAVTEKLKEAMEKVRTAP